MKPSISSKIKWLFDDGKNILVAEIGLPYKLSKGDEETSEIKLLT